MKKDFDFNKIGKRMPYKVPDNFFDALEENVRKKTNMTSGINKKSRPLSLRIILRASIGVAAVAAIFITLNLSSPNATRDNIANVEQAFDRLSSEDQIYMLDLYDDDIFITDEQNNIE